MKDKTKIYNLKDIDFEPLTKERQLQFVKDMEAAMVKHRKLLDDSLKEMNLKGLDLEPYFSEKTGNVCFRLVPYVKK